MPRQAMHHQTQSQTQKVIINMQSVDKPKAKRRKANRTQQQAQDDPTLAAAAAPVPRPPPYTYFPSVQMIQNPSPNAPIPDYIQSGYNSMQRGMENVRNDMMNHFNDLKDYLAYNSANTDPATAAQIQQILDMLQQEMGGDPSMSGASTDGLLDDSNAGTDDVIPDGVTPDAQAYDQPTVRFTDKWNTYDTPAAIYQSDAQAEQQPQTPAANLVDAFNGASTSYDPQSSSGSTVHLFKDLMKKSSKELQAIYYKLVPYKTGRRLENEKELIQRILKHQVKTSTSKQD